MGQQAHTGQAMLVAEELEADWNSIKVVTAPVHPEYIIVFQTEYRRKWKHPRLVGEAPAGRGWYTGDAD